MMTSTMIVFFYNLHDPHVVRMRAWRRARLRICGKFAAAGGSKILTLLGHSDSPGLLFSDGQACSSHHHIVVFDICASESVCVKK